MSLRLDALDRCTETIDRARTVLPDALARMHAARVGYPASGSGGTGGRGGHSSPVEAQAVAIAEHGDPGRDAIREYDHALRLIATGAATLDRLALTWTPRHPRPRDIIAAEADNAPVCKLCEDAGITEHDQGNIRRSDIGGLLAVAQRVCRWHHEWSTIEGRLPTTAETTRHHAGARVLHSAGKRETGAWA